MLQWKINKLTQMFFDILLENQIPENDVRAIRCKEKELIVFTQDKHVKKKYE